MAEVKEEARNAAAATAAVAMEAAKAAEARAVEARAAVRVRSQGQHACGSYVEGYRGVHSCYLLRVARLCVVLGSSPE